MNWVIGHSSANSEQPSEGRGSCVPGSALRTRHDRRAGYTFIEILIVIAIIGILVALLLPAVQAAREAARRSECSKHLQQLILAVHNYEMLHGVYPPGTVNVTGPIESLPKGYHHNWIVQLLPYLEEKNAFAHIDNTVGVYDPKNMPVRRLNLPLLHCTSQGYPAVGYSDYAGVHNDMEVPIDIDNNGAFFLNSRIRQVDIIDGSSHTIVLGEKLTVPGDLGWMSGTRATLRNMGLMINTGGGGRGRRRSAGLLTGYPPGVEVPGAATEQLLDDEILLDRFVEAGQTFNVRSNAPRVRSAGRWDDYGGVDSYIVDRPIGVPTDEYTPPTKASLAVGGFGSRHPGGAQFARGDGSVTFFPETVDPQLWLDLGNRADQELGHDLGW
jgi:prepilin-type N-terminal cleavage/methylation domain-containing protein/prepilin-type processing-associated H-X9-DG protein